VKGEPGGLTHLRDRILNYWASGLAAPEICTRLALPSEDFVSKALRRARKDGDPRATNRAKGGKKRRTNWNHVEHAVPDLTPPDDRVTQPMEGVPLIAAEMGIESIKRRVWKKGQVAVFNLPYLDISVPRVRWMESVR
jgi:hypothetical protein